MDTTGWGGAGSRQWRLRGFWLAWFWISWVICVVLFLAGLAVLALGVSTSGAGVPVALGVAALLLAIAGVIGWQLVSTAVTVRLDADGTVALQRQRGAVRTHVTCVRRVRPSALRSGYTPTVVETSDGWALLVNTQAERDDMVAAFRQLNPGIVVDP